MAKETVTTITCDICGMANAESHSFFFDRRCDAAGDMDNEYYDADLCAVHFGVLARICGDPSDYRQRVVGRSSAMSYGRRVMIWIKLRKVNWNEMTIDERNLALAIEAL